jgi:hypothetical protein
MPEVGLVRFGQVALDVAQATVPRYRTAFSKHRFTAAKRGKKTWTIHGVRAQMRTDFPRNKYCRRFLIETVFSVAKRKLSCRAPGRCLLTQRRQALLLGLTYNLYRLWHEL